MMMSLDYFAAPSMLWHLLPEGDIVAGIAPMGANMPATVLPLIQYFDQTYINSTVNDSRHHAPPQFPPELWSINEETLNGFTQT